MSDLLHAIQSQYPTPHRAVDSDRPTMPDDYCVGGAVCLYAQAHGYAHADDEAPQRFPAQRTLARYLGYLNPKLPKRDALYCAEAVITCNDVGAWAQAWQYVAKALEEGKPRCGQCGSPKPDGQSCLCFDNHCQ